MAAIDVLDHIHREAINATAREMFRVLKPGGRLIEVSAFHTGETIPQHLETADQWALALARAGFLEDGENWRRPLPDEATVSSLAAAD